MTETPNRGIPYVPQGTLDPGAGLNLSLDVVDALLQTAVISMALTAPPVSSAEGDLYIVAPSGASGAWLGQENNLARYRFEGNFWQFYTAGDQVALVLNLADGGLYKFVPGSPSGWTLAAGLEDAPVDGTLYGRQDGAWALIPDIPEVEGLTIQSLDDSPPTVMSDVMIVVLGEGLRFEELEPGVVLIEVESYPEVIEEAGTARTALVGDGNSYVRFTNAAVKAYTFDGGAGYPLHHEFHGRNVGAGDLTLTSAGGMTLNAPAGGSLVVPTSGTFTVKIVGATAADVFGVTSP